MWISVCLCTSDSGWDNFVFWTLEVNAQPGDEQGNQIKNYYFSEAHVLQKEVLQAAQILFALSLFS